MRMIRSENNPPQNTSAANRFGLKCFAPESCPRQTSEVVTHQPPQSVGWVKVALDRRPTKFRADWREMVGLRPERLVPPYFFRVAAASACSFRICENLRNLWINTPSRSVTPRAVSVHRFRRFAQIKSRSIHPFRDPDRATWSFRPITDVRDVHTGNIGSLHRSWPRSTRSSYSISGCDPRRPASTA